MLFFYHFNHFVLFFYETLTVLVFFPSLLASLLSSISQAHIYNDSLKSCLPLASGITTQKPS